jgi:hypothetical protein
MLGLKRQVSVSVAGLQHPLTKTKHSDDERYEKELEST